MPCRGEKVAMKGLKIVEKAFLSFTINLFLKKGYSYSAR